MDVSEEPDAGTRDGEESEDREEGRGGEGDGPDAPTAVEHNEGMSTVLSADTLDGVQSDAGEE